VGPARVRERHAVRDDNVNDESQVKGVSAATVALAMDAALKAAALHLHL
jgi:hypothetical protein